jgi:hypothetical protein
MRHVLVIVCVVVTACVQSRPLRPLSPRYPEVLSASGVGGQVVARVKIDRAGKVVAVNFEGPGNAASPFLESIVKSKIRTTQFAPARLLGVSRSSERSYLFTFVLIKPDRVLNENERWSAWADSLQATCPTSSSRRDVIVCAEARPIVVHVLHSFSQLAVTHSGM